MFYVVLAMGYVAMSLFLAIKASRAETNKGFQIGMGASMVLLINAVLLSMGILWLTGLINVVLMVLTLWVSILMYKNGKTLHSLYYLILTGVLAYTGVMLFLG